MLCTGCTKLCEQTYWRLFCNERAEATLLDPKLMFRCVLCDLTKVKTGRTNLVWAVQQMHETVRTNFEEIISQRTCPIHLIRSKTLVSLSFVRFNRKGNGKDEVDLCWAPDV